VGSDGQTGPAIKRSHRARPTASRDATASTQPVTITVPGISGSRDASPRVGPFLRVKISTFVERLCHDHTFACVCLACVTNHRIVREHQPGQAPTLRNTEVSGPQKPASDRLAAGQGARPSVLSEGPAPHPAGRREKRGVEGVIPPDPRAVDRVVDVVSCVGVNLGGEPASAVRDTRRPGRRGPHGEPVRTGFSKDNP
jgi:hypothetical protein